MNGRGGWVPCLVFRTTNILGHLSIHPSTTQVGLARFKTLTLRCFKLGRLEDRCEEYGQFATYLGTLPETPGAFVLDNAHTFEKGRATPVCGNTALMVRCVRREKRTCWASSWLCLRERGEP